MTNRQAEGGTRTPRKLYRRLADGVSANAESKYSFRAYRRGDTMVMKLAVRVPNSLGSTDFHLVSSGKFEEVVSLDDPEKVVAAIRRAFSGTLGGKGESAEAEQLTPATLHLPVRRQGSRSRASGINTIPQGQATKAKALMSFEAAMLQIDLNGASGEDPYLGTLGGNLMEGDRRFPPSGA